MLFNKFSKCMCVCVYIYTHIYTDIYIHFVQSQLCTGKLHLVLSTLNIHPVRAPGGSWPCFPCDPLGARVGSVTVTL